MADLFISYCSRCTPQEVREKIDSYIQDRQGPPDVTVRLDGSDCHLECESGPVQLRFRGKTRLYLEHAGEAGHAFDRLKPGSEVRRMVRETLAAAGFSEPPD